VEDALAALALSEVRRPPAGESSGTSRRPLALRPRPLWSTANHRPAPPPPAPPVPAAVSPPPRPPLPLRMIAVAASITLILVLALIGLRGCSG
jgi:hypothetical protein